MYMRAPRPKAPAISRSMKVGTPTSMPPGPTSSLGINVSTSATMTAASMLVKNLGGSIPATGADVR